MFKNEGVPWVLLGIRDLGNHECMDEVSGSTHANDSKYTLPCIFKKESPNLKYFRKLPPKFSRIYGGGMDSQQSTTIASRVKCDQQSIQAHSQSLVTMDTPKQEVSFLETSPPDIWAYFVCYLPGEQLGRLMMTGARLLRQRLKFPTVVKSINLGEDFILFKSYPKFLNEFPSLQKLSIHSSSDDWGRKLGLALDLMPSGLKKLYLSGTWNKCGDTLFGYYNAAFKLDQSLPQLEVLDVSPVLISSYSWMAHTPQSLTKLSVRRWTGTAELPSSLIHFKADQVDLSTHSITKLPPSLESFVITTSLVGVELVVPFLPPSCRKLDLSKQAKYVPAPSSQQFGRYRDIRAEPKSPPNFFDQLPQSLTWFKVPLCTIVDSGTIPKFISLLPSTITVLDIIPSLPCSAWPLLPPKLVALYMNAFDMASIAVTTLIDDHGTRRQVSTSPFDCLPRSITILQIKLHTYKHFCGPPNIHGSFFPPKLTSLKIFNIQLSPEAAELLPATLTHLEMGNFCERICAHLPSGLTSLISDATLMSPNLIKFLPKSLTFLQLSILRAEDPWFDCDTGKLIVSISKLPEYSIHKNSISNSFDWKDASPLPSTLTYLVIDNAKYLGDSFMIHQQLPNLLELKFEHSQHFSDTLIPLLSPLLVTLNIPSSRNISGKSFEFLPRCLVFLNLNSSESIFDSDIQHLPRTLEYAHLSRAIHLTDLCIPDLPPHLEKLTMTFNNKITPSTFPNLPYPLRSSQNYTSAAFSNWAIYYGVVRIN